MVVNYLISDKGVCRTAPATPGLSKRLNTNTDMNIFTGIRKYEYNYENFNTLPSMGKPACEYSLRAKLFTKFLLE